MENYNQLINKAKFFYKSNEFENAKNCLLEVIKNFKLDANIKLNISLLLVDVLNKLNDFKDIEKYLLEYLEFNSTNSKILNLTANNYSKMRKFHKSEEYYMKAIDINQNDESAIINLAVLLENLGRDSDALNFYKQKSTMYSENIKIRCFIQISKNPILR